MISAIISYLLTLVCINLILVKKNCSYSNFGKLALKKQGIIFFSTKSHKIKVGNAKIFQVGKIVYLKRGDKFVEIDNIDALRRIGSYLHFKACGKVIINLNLSDWKYFNIVLNSQYFNFENLKQKVLHDMLKDIFSMEQNSMLKRYLDLIKSGLKIEISNESLTIKKGEIKFPFSIKYKINNIIKRINIKNCKNL